MELRIGDFVPAAPVVLAPMAGVTNAPFRALCRRFGPGLVYVNEMVMATAVVHGNAKTTQMMTFGPDEHPRSLQIYGSDPEMMGRAVASLCGRGIVDHVDLNFGCPAAKVTRRGGGAAVPAKPALLTAIVRAAVRAGQPYGVPVTAKFRMGLFDDHLTYLRAGTICEAEGVVAVGLHARTAEQHYAGEARWDAIAELKAHVTTIPVLGNGDIWMADDAVEMMCQTGCDGVVIGRGCLGRPWLFGDLLARLRPAQDASERAPASERSAPTCVAGERNDGPSPPSRPLGFVVDVMGDHGRLLAEHLGDEFLAMRDFRKHTAWYFTGYPVGPEVRRRAAMVSSLAELDEIVGPLDRDISIVDGGERIRRGHTNGPIRVSLPDGFLADRDLLEHDITVPDDNDVVALSGG